LDIRTIILALAIGNLVFGVMLILFQQRQEKTLRNPFWTAAKFLQSAGWLLLAGRGTIADLLSFTLGNICLLAGYAYECWAIYRISERPVTTVHQAATILYAVVSGLLITPLNPGERIAAASFLVLPIMVLSTWAMFSSPQRSPLRIYLGWSIGLLAMALLGRGLVALLAPHGFMLFSGNTIQWITFSILFYLMLTNGFGLLLLSREATDQQLQEVLKEQQAILDTLPTGLCILRNRVVVQCNPAMEAMFGFAPGTLAGQSVRSLFASDEAFHAYGRTIYQEIAATGRFEGEVLYCRQNGELFWAKDHGRTIVLGDRPEAYTVFSVIDISEQKKQQDLLLRQKEELETTVARIKRLEGIISICMYCKKIRNEQDSWEQLEKYLTENTDARFSHGLCPECYAKFRIRSTDAAQDDRRSR
jgi:PAS domain S-box-containing protein